jgi:hypothetical protein
MNAAVVVPVRGADPATLANLRATARAGRRAAARILLVDNGMAAPLRAAVAAEALADIVECPTVGSYPARNAGLRRALRDGNDPILFTDADCRPHDGWPEHLIELLGGADIATTVAAPRPVSLIGRGAHADYRARLTRWAGSDIRCGAPMGTMDTRACAVRAEVFAGGLFGEELTFAGDAVFGRRARRAGYRVVGCSHTIMSHDPPATWAGEFAKYRRIAATLVDDLRALPRRDVLHLLPEHAHLLLAPPDGLLRERRRRLAAATRDPAADEPAAEALYVAVRELAWVRGWQQRHAGRVRDDTRPARRERGPQ